MAASLVVVISLMSVAAMTYLSGLRTERTALRGDNQAPVSQSVAEPASRQTGPSAILSASDADLYRRIFALQREGDLGGAKALVAQIDDALLMGHVLAQRLQFTANPRNQDLRHWLREYEDHPDAVWIHAFYKKRLPKKDRRKVKRLSRRAGLAVIPDPPRPYASKKNLTRKQQRRVRRIKKAIRIWLRRGQVRRTEKLLQRGYVIRLLDRYEMDDARARIAAAWFYQGKAKKSLKLAETAIAGSGKKLPMAHWTAGLAAWKIGRIEQAVSHFETLAKTTDRSGWIRAGAALWAARGHQALKAPDAASHWFEQAARYPYTLYGVIALTELDQKLPFASHQPQPFTAAMAELIATDLGGRRALALGEIGEIRRAEQELLSIKKWNRPALRAALAGIADHLGIPSIPLKLVRRERAAKPGISVDQPLDLAHFPVLPWQLDTKSKIDQALLLAFMRQESDFNAAALSPAGALGLMQIMPNTARMLNRGRRFRGTKRLDWADPVINAGLGQRYLVHLRTNRRVRGDLLKMIAAYNSGPGNIGYWARKKIGQTDDPMLFMESIPNLETRLFVRRVLANLWIYRARLGQQAPSLQAMAAGAFPRYRAIDGKDKPANVANNNAPGE